MCIRDRSITAWAAERVSVGDFPGVADPEMSKAHLLALARYAGSDRETTKRHLAAVDVYWG
eukprot:1355882-Alexandrium_andersonii.AAC.1